MKRYFFEPDVVRLGIPISSGYYCRTGDDTSCYKTDKSWIDVDNNVWAEPSHLYTADAPYVPSLHIAWKI